jgi:hypothetical protein
MNIFYLDKCPKKAAQYQYNKHVVKMILESAQMLCTAHHVYGNPNDVPYKQAHLNHPSTVWVRNNSLHYEWLFQHMMHLGDEYTKRYGKTHLSITKCWDKLCHLPANIPHEQWEQPPQCMPDKYKDKCSVKAYWNYYIGEKHIVANPKTEKIYEKI